ncbi:MAG TPA: trypsin-like peptidase domain-containing protein [Casimicrobiaceae bacterium]|nr:trypsin-like peptidase domain-containing protein [Casimicrobiaceae bacterium]
MKREPVTGAATGSRSPALARALALAALALGLAGGGVFALPLEPAAFLPLSASVVRVEVQRAQGGLGIGSGVTLAPDVVVTNCHVTRDATVIRVSGAGRTWEVTGEYAQGTHDVCFLRVPGWNGRAVALSEREPLQVGEPVAAIGFTGGMGRGLQFGQVRALHALDGGEVIETDAAFTSGASGGGLFDAQGTLVGLLTFRSLENGGAYYALPAAWIRERIPDAQQWTDVRPLHDAAAFWQRDSATQPYFMRAASLSAEHRWAELIELTAAWAKASPADAEPFRLRGRAFQQTHLDESAVQSFSEALRLDPADATSWYGLGLAYAALGDDSSSQGAQDVLSGIDEALASRLRDAIARLHGTR